MIKPKMIIDTGLGSISKSWLICRKAKIGSVRTFIVNSKTRVILQKNSQIIINGNFRMGIKTGLDLMTSAVPCVLKLGENSKLIINGNVALADGVYVSLEPNAVLELNDGCFVNANSKIICYKKITIGKGSIISWDTQVCDSDIHCVIKENSQNTLPIEIGENVWVGSNVNILKGVRIGSGAIIGANAVVSRDVPEKSLAVGSPARVIKTKVEWQM
jgi:acetyltransferase-like isoleucine patch superfamily enzyme